jgi:hydroxymethylglutaryl-CoA lyase
MSGYPKILHTEEGMRDGLQIENEAIPVADKIRLLDALSETGLKEIAVGSFVSPRYTPQMACIDELVRGFHPKPGIRYTYTALNEMGYERAHALTPPLSPRVSEFSTKYTMCDVFAQRNTNRTQAQELAKWPAQIEKARAHGATHGNVSISAAWGSNWTDGVTLDERMRILESMISLWNEAGIPVKYISFSDPMSWCMPDQVERQLAEVKKRWPSITDFNLHLHNGRGTALASFYAALRVLDGTDTLRIQSAIGGMAGCPYCGNGRAASMIATEDLMHMLEEMGIETGLDLYKLIEVVWLAEKIVGHPLYGFVSKAGPRPHDERLYAMNMPRVETLDQAKHFILGPAAYQGAPSPWKKPITSQQRPDLLKTATGKSVEQPSPAATLSAADAKVS